MNKIPKRLLSEILNDDYYKSCARKFEGECEGRITLEHALLYAGKQVQEKFAILPLCYRHHLGDRLNKQMNIRIAMSRATKENLKNYPKNTWLHQSKWR